MEFFLPGLAVILIGVLIAYAVIPRFSPVILALISIVLLVAALYDHFRIFSYEYAYSTWQEQLKSYAPYVMIGALLVSIIFFFMYIFGGGRPKANNTISEAIENMPNANTATNPLTEAINNTLKAVNNIVTGNNANKKNGANTGANTGPGLLEKVNNSIVNTFSNVKSLIEGEQAPAKPTQ
jgi:predicted PurR-regulated permease PerM